MDKKDGKSALHVTVFYTFQNNPFWWWCDLNSPFYILESLWYDSPDRQTFVTEGWFVAGDFLQWERNMSGTIKTRSPNVKQMIALFFHSVVWFQQQSILPQHKHKTGGPLVLRTGHRSDFLLCDTVMSYSIFAQVTPLSPLRSYWLCKTDATAVTDPVQYWERDFLYSPNEMR